MAITGFTDEGAAGSAASLAALDSTPFTVAAGDLIIVAGQANRIGGGLSSLTISDTEGLTWTERESVATSAGITTGLGKVWTAVANGNETTVTITPDLSCLRWTLSIASVQGDGTPTYEQSNAATGSTATGQPTVTLDTTPSEAVFSACFNGQGQTTTPGTDFTEINDAASAGGNDCGCQMQYDLAGNTDGVCDASGLTGSNWAIVGIEIVDVSAGGTSVEVPVASLSLTGYAPAPSAPNAVTIPVAALSLTGFAPTVSAPAVVTVPAASLTLTGQAPSVSAPNRVEVPVAALSLSGQAPTVTYGPATVTPGVAALAITGYAPTANTGANVSVEVPTASLTLSTAAPAVSAPYALTVPAAALSLTGLAPTVAYGPATVTPGAGTLTLTGYAPSAITADPIVIDVEASLSVVRTLSASLAVVRSPAASLSVVRTVDASLELS